MTDETYCAEIKILSGKHSGARHSFAEGVLTIGSSFEADVVLTDSSVAPLHAKIDVLKTRIEIEAISEVSVDQVTIKAGEKRAFGFPARIKIGAVELEFYDINKRFASPKSAIENNLPIVFFVAVLFIGAMLLDRFVNISGVDSPASNNKTSALAPKLQDLNAKNSVDAIEKARLTIEGQELLQKHLVSQNLSELSVSGSAGVISVKGILQPEAVETWRASQIWFDQNFAGRLVLNSDVTVAQKKTVAAPIAIQAIWAGNVPYFIDGKGDKYFEGSMLRNGWTVDKIEYGKVTLKRNTEMVTLSAL